MLTDTIFKNYNNNTLCSNKCEQNCRVKRIKQVSSFQAFPDPFKSPLQSSSSHPAPLMRKGKWACFSENRDTASKGSIIFPLSTSGFFFTDHFFPFFWSHLLSPHLSPLFLPLFVSSGFIQHIQQFMEQGQSSIPKQLCGLGRII